MINQDFDDLSDVNSYSAKLTYTEPLGKRRYVEFNYQHSQNQTDVDRAVFDVRNGERIYNEQLSNLYRSGYTYNNFGINFLVNRPKYNLTVGATLQNSVLDGELLLADQVITQDLTNILPKLNYRYSFTSTKNLTLDYSTNVIEPTIQQLQPIVDNSNPLNIYVGNENLRPEFRHNIRLRFFSFNPGNFTNFFSTLSFTYATNKIRNTQFIDEDLIRTTTPVNVSDDYRVNLYTNFGTRFNKLQFRFNISPNALYTKGIVFVNDVRNNINSITTGTRIRFDNQKKEKIDVGFGGNFSYTSTQYSISSEQNQAFINHSYFTDLTLTLSESLNFSTNFDYTLYNGITDDFSQDVPIWNASVSIFFLKGKKGQLRLGVNDILDENRGVSRINDVNSIIDETVNALGRYYLATFTYAIRGFNANNSGSRSRGRR